MSLVRPALGPWWFIPGTGWPPYAHAKLFLRRVPGTETRSDPGLFCLGLRLERGLGRQLAGRQWPGDPEALDLVDPLLTMQPSWFWHRFLNDTLGGLINTPLRALLERSEQPLTIELDLYRADSVPAPDRGDVWPDDHMAFAILDEGLLLHPIELARAELKPLSEAATLRELVLQIEGVPKLTWYWINVRIGVQVSYGAPDAKDAWDAPELWHRAMEPWLPWLH